MKTKKNKKSIFSVLKSRGFIHQYTDEVLRTVLVNKKISVYCGIDPTADSLHVGHLIPLLALIHLQKYGHSPIILIGGATSLIGDPSGKMKERQLINAKTIENNTKKIKKQLCNFFSCTASTSSLKIVNNLDWFKKILFIDFLREVGKNFIMNNMLNKEAVRRRIENPEMSISFAEFSYMLLQAYDFFYLNKYYGCELQIGGSDQWGNIIAGINLVKKLSNKTVYGITCPLITTTSGEKFGKTGLNTVWLSPQKTSPYDFYQFWFNVEDKDIVKFLKLYTFLPISEIQKASEELKNRPHLRCAQKILAFEMTKLIHGEQIARGIKSLFEVLFSGNMEDLENLNKASISTLLSKSRAPCITIEKQSLCKGMPIIDVLTKSKLCSSKGEAIRLIKNKGVYINNKPVRDIKYILCMKDIISQRVILLRKGKKHNFLIIIK